MISDSDISDFDCTPPKIILQAAKIVDTIIPEKSKLRYEKVYMKFMDWRTENSIVSFSENVVLAYFGEISKTFKPSSLWAIYSMLRTMINVRNDVNIAKYPKLKAFLKRQYDGYKTIKSNILKPDEINNFIVNAPDREYLLTKVILICGISGACRKQELKNLKMANIEDTGNTLLFKILDTKTKIDRSFIVSGTFYKICKQYIQIRQNVQDENISQFFLRYEKGKCYRQVTGINKIGKTPKEIAKYLKLPNPDKYTGHCFRRSSATLLVDAGGDLLKLKRHGGWKSSTVAESYLDNSMLNKNLTANTILTSIEDNRDDISKIVPSTSQPINAVPTISTSNLNKISVSVPATSSMVVQKSGHPIIIKNCQNFTLNINSN